MTDPTLRSLERMLGQDPLLKDLLSGNPPGPRKGGRFRPDVDVIEADGMYIVRMDVPGVTLDKLDVELDGSRLVVRGRRDESRPTGAKMRTAERGRGAFERVFLLPSQTLAGAVMAELDHGVLTVEVPVGRSGRPRKVPVIAKGAEEG